MMTDSWWIQFIDHRISAAVVFFVLLLLIGNGRRRERFALRAVGSLAALTSVSWLIRFAIDVLPQYPRLQGVLYGLHTMSMVMLFGLSYCLCWKAKPRESVYPALMALTIFKLGWNLFKAAANAFMNVNIPALWSNYSVMGSVVSYLVYITVGILACMIFRSAVSRMPADLPRFITVVIVVCQMVLEYCGHIFSAEPPIMLIYYICALLYTVITFCALLMAGILEDVRRDNASMHDFISNKMQYYRMSREGIQSLQTKCHDLKHQIAAIRSEAGRQRFDQYLNRLEDSINEYSTVVECGNDIIDVVLTEKNILCSTAGVRFTYMVDGTLFSFLTERELYSLFGNVLDNALESASAVSDPGRRMISLKSVAHGDMAVLHAENYYEGELNPLVEGLPQTTKSGSGHGFGLRSIRNIAEKHGGTVSIRTEDGLFKLTVIMHRE